MEWFWLLGKGVVIGFAIAAPVGPIGVLCIRRSLHDGLTSGLVCGLGYSLLDATNLVSFDAEIAHLVMLMGLTYIAAIIALHRQYR